MESLQSFSKLIYLFLNEAAKSDDPLKHEAITFLIEHEGLVGSIVQWASFWYTESCPDLFDEIGIDDFTLIHNYGKVSTRLLVEGRHSLRETIASTPVSLPGKFTVSFMVGLTRRTKMPFEEDYSSTLHHLIVDGDCVDKSVIVEMIDFGVNSVEYEEATLVANYMFSMLYQGTVVSEQYLSDARVAFAIREGLIQMCLTFMERFGDQISNQNDIRTKLFSYVEGIFNAVHDVALHKKSWKAIRHVRLDIEERLDHLGTSIIHYVKCKKLLDVIKSIVDMNGAHCCHCNKSLGRKERYQCGDCNRMTYCSRACQRSDWLNGHNLTCCKTITTDNKIGQFQGRLLPITIPSNERDASKLKELEINNNMIQLKVFLDHSSTILEQAKSLNIPLFDCIVKFDLCCCPPEITTLHYSECYSSSQKHYEASRSTKNITCLYYSFNFIGDVVATSHLEQDIATLLAVQRLFPCEWLTHKK